MLTGVTIIKINFFKNVLGIGKKRPKKGLLRKSPFLIYLKGTILNFVSAIEIIEVTIRAEFNLIFYTSKILFGQSQFLLRLSNTTFLVYAS